jgi:hypothetical protein
MSDIRFKISGTSKPFIAEVHRVSDESIVAKKLVEYAGFSQPDMCNYTCVIFNNLNENESYRLKICDSVGNVLFKSNQYVTPVNPVYIPKNININLGGTVKGTSSLYVISGDNEIEITPTLTLGQCVDITLLNTDISNFSGENSRIDIYKKCTSSGSFNLVKSINDLINEPVSLKMGNGDSICYDAFGTFNSCVSCSEISIGTASLSGNFSETDVLSCGPQTNLKLALPITTTTTTVSPTTIFSVCREHENVLNDGVTLFASGTIREGGESIYGNERVTITYCGCVLDSSFELFCKPSGGQTFQLIGNYVSNVIGNKSFKSSFAITEGDCVCYELLAGSESLSCFELIDVVGEGGLNPIISSVKNSDQLPPPPPPTTFSVCRESFNKLDSITTVANGTIREGGESIYGDEYVIITYCGCVYEQSNPDFSTSFVKLSCKSSGSQTFELFQEYNTDVIGNINFENTFIIREGDCICYDLSVSAGTDGALSTSCFTLTNVVGEGGLNPDISSLKYSDCIVEQYGSS